MDAYLSDCATDIVLALLGMTVAAVGIWLELRYRRTKADLRSLIHTGSRMREEQQAYEEAKTCVAPGYKKRFEDLFDSLLVQVSRRFKGC